MGSSENNYDYPDFLTLDTQGNLTIAPSSNEDVGKHDIVIGCKVKNTNSDELSLKPYLPIHLYEFSVIVEEMENEAPSYS